MFHDRVLMMEHLWPTVGWHSRWRDEREKARWTIVDWHETHLWEVGYWITM